MPQTDISSASSSNMSNLEDFDYSVYPQVTDGPTGSKETEYQCTQWSQWFGYYNTLPELRAAINVKSLWTVGKGFKTLDPQTESTLDNIRGFGVDKFNTILYNMHRTTQICGDAYAEIIRNDEGKLINLKVLDPSSIKIIADEQGIIKRYEQTDKTSKKPIIKFKPEEIFHLTKDRIADEIHGRGIIESVENVILSRNESMADQKKLMHRNIKPVIVFQVDSDDEVKIAEFTAKMDNAVKNGENIYIPKGSVEYTILSVPPNATLNPLPWMDDLKNFFFQAVGVPQILLGGAAEFSESSAKIAYLSYQQVCEFDQLDIEEQVWEQLQLRIELDFPASLENDLISDQKKDANQGMEFQAGDTTAGVGR